MHTYSDCLTLNVWKPTNATANAKLPVSVYIHVRRFLTDINRD